MSGTDSSGPFLVSAPGKVIVFGEHAVVHGKTAIAAAISLRSYLLVTPAEQGSDSITLEFPDVELRHSWSRNELPWDAFQHPSRAKQHHDRLIARDEHLLEAMHPYVQAVSPNLPEPKRNVHQMGASTFLYLLLSLSTRNSTPCTYTLRSTIPTGAGLGSSASISVCFSAALLYQAGRLPKASNGSPISAESNEEALHFINNWAYVGELCIHGNPSGLDNTVATRGRAVLFKRFDKTKPPSVKPLHNFPLLNLLLVDTKQPRSTLSEVAKVQTLKDRYPTLVEHMLDAIGGITEQVHSLIDSNDFDPSSDESVNQLGELIRMNHGILAGLGVSHPKLERVRQAIDESDLGWTKLTGAGGGGCAFTLLRRNVKHERLEHVLNGLADDGFDNFEAFLGSVGVGVLEFSDVKNNNITREELLRAGGQTDVEALVGVGSDGKENGWKFWDTT